MVKGEITDPDSPESRIPIDRAEMTLDWNNAQHALAMPFQIVSGGTRFTLIARAEAPRDPAGSWALGLTGGSVVLSPAEPRRGAGAAQPHHRARPARSGGAAAQHRAGRGVGQGRRVAMSGNLDFSTSDPRLAIGLATRNMSVRRVQAVVAALHQSAGAQMGHGARLRRHRRAGRDRDQCAALDAAQWRAAGARRRPVDPDRHQRHHGAAVRQSAGNSRRRSRHPHQGPQRHRHARPRHRSRCRRAAA